MFCAFTAPQSRDGLLLSCAVFKCKMQNAKCRIQNAKCKIQNAKCRIQNAEFKMQNSKFKMQNSKCSSISSNSEVIELFLCDARRQNRSIVSLCEDFGVRSTRAKRANQNEFTYSFSTTACKSFIDTSLPFSRSKCSSGLRLQYL